PGGRPARCRSQGIRGRARPRPQARGHRFPDRTGLRAIGPPRPCPGLVPPGAGAAPRQPGSARLADGEREGSVGEATRETSHRGRRAGVRPVRVRAPGGRSLTSGRIAVVLLAVHAALALWGAARNSVTYDENFHLPSGIGSLASVSAWWGLARSGGWRWWAWTALAVGLTALVRFTALLILPVLAALALTATLGLRVRRPGRLWVGLILLLPATLLMIQLGYLGKCSFASLAQQSFYSHGLNSLRLSMPWLRLPLPDAYVSGLDWQSFEAQVASPPTYLLGH